MWSFVVCGAIVDNQHSSAHIDLVQSSIGQFSIIWTLPGADQQSIPQVEKFSIVYYETRNSSGKHCNIALETPFFKPDKVLCKCYL